MKYYEISYRHRVEPVTLSKYVVEYDQMWKWMIEFLSKFQGRVIKIDRVNSIRVAKSRIYFNILRAIAPWVTSSRANVFFALTLRRLPLFLYFGCIGQVDAYYVATSNNTRKLTTKIKAVSTGKFHHSVIIKCVRIIIKIERYIVICASSMLDIICYTSKCPWDITRFNISIHSDNKRTAYQN